MHDRIRCWRCSGCGLRLGAGASLAEYPEKPIRLLLPFPAGGAVDIVARVMTAKMADDLGKPFVIENKSGAGGIIATDAVAKSPPDGYTLLLTTPNHTINAALQASLPYDTEKDLVAGLGHRRGAGGAGELSRRAVCELSRSSSPTPGPIPARSTMPRPASARLPHVTMELLLRRTGIEVTHIPYRGAAPAMTDLLAGLGAAQARHLHHVEAAGCGRQAPHARHRQPRTAPS